MLISTAHLPEPAEGEEIFDSGGALSTFSRA
jgi:hypothetical protein